MVQKLIEVYFIFIRDNLLKDILICDISSVKDIQLINYNEGKRILLIGELVKLIVITIQIKVEGNSPMELLEPYSSKLYELHWSLNMVILVNRHQVLLMKELRLDTDRLLLTKKLVKV